MIYNSVKLILQTVKYLCTACCLNCWILTHTSLYSQHCNFNTMQLQSSIHLSIWASLSTRVSNTIIGKINGNLECAIGTCAEILVSIVYTARLYCIALLCNPDVLCCDSFFGLVCLAPCYTLSRQIYDHNFCVHEHAEWVKHRALAKKVFDSYRISYAIWIGSHAFAMFAHKNYYGCAGTLMTLYQT